MDNSKVLAINQFVNECYDSLSFADFLKHSILKLHSLLQYDSGMFYCSISRDCSFFKPYTSGNIKDYYEKSSFENPGPSSWPDSALIGKEAYVYKASDYKKGMITVPFEPRRSFISGQDDFHIACVRIVYKGQFMGEIYLHRSRQKPDFSDEDMFTLSLLQPHVSTVFNIIHTINSVKSVESGGQANGQKGICLFDDELTLTGGNAVGMDMLRITTKFGSSVLYHAKEFCRSISSSQQGCSKSGARFASSTVDVPGSDIRLDVLSRDPGVHNNGVRFIVIMEFVFDGKNTQDYKYKFSAREAEVIDELIQGKNNQSIAHALNISENTVKTHIKNIYKKTGTNSRTELAYVLMMKND